MYIRTDHVKVSVTRTSYLDLEHKQELRTLHCLKHRKCKVELYIQHP